jgi:hypothetical protein
MKQPSGSLITQGITEVRVAEERYRFEPIDTVFAARWADARKGKRHHLIARSFSLKREFVFTAGHRCVGRAQPSQKESVKFRDIPVMWSPKQKRR